MVRYYDHPILWSEDRKRLEERKISDRSIREWRVRQKQERINKNKEQQEVSLCLNLHTKCFWKISRNF